MKFYHLSLCFIVFFQLSWSQSELNAYKFIVVPEQYEFLKGKDTYQLNSLTKFLFNRKGFEAFLTSDQLPDELFNNRCSALYADVLQEKGGFKSRKLKVVLRDCRNNEVFETRIGKSGQNNHQKAFQLALRDAFVTIDMLPYKYDSTLLEEERSVKDNEEIAAVPIEVSSKEVALSSEAQGIETLNTTAIKPQVSDQIKTPLFALSYDADEVLQAVPNQLGFNVKDLAESEVMTLLKTPVKDVYMVKGTDALVYKNGEEWRISSLKDGRMTDQPLNLKF